jgi:hypothetical protein
MGLFSYMPSCPTRGTLDVNGHWRVELTSPPSSKGGYFCSLGCLCSRGSNCDIAHIIRPHMAARVHHGGIADAQHSSTVRYVRVHCRGTSRPPCGMVMRVLRPRPYGTVLQSYCAFLRYSQCGPSYRRCNVKAPVQRWRCPCVPGGPRGVWQQPRAVPLRSAPELRVPGMPCCPFGEFSRLEPAGGDASRTHPYSTSYVGLPSRSKTRYLCGGDKILSAQVVDQ